MTIDPPVSASIHQTITGSSINHKMTYQQYYNKLIKELEHSEKNIVKQKKLLKGEKGYLDQQDLYIYMGLINDNHSLFNKCSIVLELIVENKVNPHEEIDPDKLPGVKSIQ